MANDSKIFMTVAHKKIGETLMKDDKLLEILKEYHVVRLDDNDDFNDKLTWCMEHCHNKFRDIREPNCRAWYFQNEYDAAIFAMRWS